MDAEWFLQGHSHEGYRPQVTEKQQLARELHKFQVQINKKQYELGRLKAGADMLRRRIAELPSNTTESHYA